MLHGYPENHLMWRHVAPGLARDYTVVLADLRGYGDSGKPAPDADGNAYSKRLMARDQVELMRHFGFGRFQLVGHDRGARVAHRLALDHPGAVTKLAVLDIAPTRHVFRNVTRSMAAAYYHWLVCLVGKRPARAPDRRGPRVLDPFPDRPAPRQGRQHRPGRDGGLHPLLQRPPNHRGFLR